MVKERRLSGPAPGFLRMPDYKVDVELSKSRIKAYVRETCIADSTRTLVMTETNHMPVYYFPPVDVINDYLEKTDRDSF